MTSATHPNAKQQQRAEALRRANEIRVHRAAEKRHLRTLPTAAQADWLRQVILDPPDRWASSSIVDLLAIPARWDRIRALNALDIANRAQPARIRETAQIGTLKRAQREALAGALESARSRHWIGTTETPTTAPNVEQDDRIRDLTAQVGRLRQQRDQLLTQQRCLNAENRRLRALVKRALA